MRCKPGHAGGSCQAIDHVPISRTAIHERHSRKNSPINPGKIIRQRGSVHRAGGDDSDYFVFTPPDSGDYHVNLCNDPIACLRGTSSANWDLTVYDHDLTVLAGTNPGRVYERKVMLALDAGLPYYVRVVDRGENSQYWQYNLTIIRD